MLAPHSALRTIGTQLGRSMEIDQTSAQSPSRNISFEASTEAHAPSANAESIAAL